MMEEDKEMPQSGMGHASQFKRDAVWKPVIRLFRRYLKKDAMPKAMYKRIHAQAICEQGALFCEALGMPRDLAEKPKSARAVLMMISSHRITRKKKLIPHARRFMGRLANEIWMNYFEVFNENSQRQRF